MVQFKKKIHGSGTKTVTFSNEEINDMVNTVKALENADILEKGIRITLQNDVKKGRSLPILPMLLGTLGSSLIEHILSGRGLRRAGTNNKCNCGKEIYRADEGNRLFKAEQGIKKSINATTPFNKS